MKNGLVSKRGGRRRAQSSQGIEVADNDSTQKSAAALSNSKLHLFSEMYKSLMFNWAKQSSRTDG